MLVVVWCYVRLVIFYCCLSVFGLNLSELLSGFVSVWKYVVFLRIRMYFDMLRIDLF